MNIRPSLLLAALQPVEQGGSLGSLLWISWIRGQRCWGILFVCSSEEETLWLLRVFLALVTELLKAKGLAQFRNLPT